MLLARVEGSVISTICHETMHGWRTLICQPLNDAGEHQGTPILALDKLGAGMHQRVVVSSDGKTTQEWVGTRHTPLRYIIIGVVDKDDN